MFRGSLRERSENAADVVESALTAHALHVSAGSLLDLRCLVDSGCFRADVLDHVRSVVDGDAFTLVPLDRPIIDAMSKVPRDHVPDPFDRSTAATALRRDLPLVTADETIQGAIGQRVVW